MNKIIICICCCSIIAIAYAQLTPAQLLAHTQAQTMKDSLSLDTLQKLKIYDVNMQLFNMKGVVRKQYAGMPSDTILFHLQLVEGIRDSLYKAILSTDKYLIYLDKKPELLSVH